MARIFITGSSDGLGQLAAQSLVAEGHKVVLHARNALRAKQAMAEVPGAEDVVIGELSSVEETKNLAAQVNALGSFDAVIYNAGIYRAQGELMFNVNTLAPYILTCLIQKPARIVYLSSGVHKQGTASVDGLAEDISQYSYADSKLHNLMLCKTVARTWPNVYANALHPGWVPTKMGGTNAPDNLQKGYETQVWLAVSNDEAAKVSGRYFFHKIVVPYNMQADDVELQYKLLTFCEQKSGVRFPA